LDWCSFIDTLRLSLIYTKKVQIFMIPNFCYHMWRCLGFSHPTSSLARNFLKFLPQPQHAMTRQVVKFRHFRTPFRFYKI
jgi:hypothetical protein